MITPPSFLGHVDAALGLHPRRFWPAAPAMASVLYGTPKLASSPFIKHIYLPDFFFFAATFQTGSEEFVFSVLWNLYPVCPGSD
jgi:hypothetical protein